MTEMSEQWTVREGRHVYRAHAWNEYDEDRWVASFADPAVATVVVAMVNDQAAEREAYARRRAHGALWDARSKLVRAGLRRDSLAITTLAEMISQYEPSPTKED